MEDKISSDNPYDVEFGQHAIYKRVSKFQSVCGGGGGGGAQYRTVILPLVYDKPLFRCMIIR